MVDVSEPDTIGLAPTWKQDVLNHAHFTVAHNTANESRDAIMASSIPVLLLGNKADKLEVYTNKLCLNCLKSIKILHVFYNLEWLGQCQ